MRIRDFVGGTFTITGYFGFLEAFMLIVTGIQKSYEGKPLLKGISFEVHEGETVCLLGHSGSGKSTLLRIIAGIEQQEQGSICWNGEDLRDCPIHKRNFGLMFQDYALFPHKNVFENVAFGLRMLNYPEQVIRERVQVELEKVKMWSFSQRRVADLSGGEQQRVALARALAPKPRLLMLDEPLGALDKTLRAQLLKEIRALLHETRISAIYVTHDQEEAFTIGDNLALLNEGKIIQFGTPKTIFQHPENTWVAEFLGLTNLVPGVVQSLRPLSVSTAIGVFSLTEIAPQTLSLRSPVELLLRPSAILESGAPTNQIEGKILDSIYLGESYRILFACDGMNLEFEVAGEYQVGETVRFSVDPQEIQWFLKE
jgi:ABC-type Fe3+/spermidine/putrescine transport system ATPase subunit